MADNGQHSVKADTEYLVLKLNDGAWTQVGFVTARDPQAAIKAKLEQATTSDGQTGTFVAVAHARWNPVTVKPQIVTTFEFEAVKS